MGSGASKTARAVGRFLSTTEKYEPREKKEKKQLPTEVVTRCEIRELPLAEQERFGRAMQKLRENTSGPGTSEYLRLAAIHGGMPSFTEMAEYCVHGREAFPTWHRGYMKEFETALRHADLELGGDGQIGLPYWDWTRYEVNGEVIPKILRDQRFFPSVFPTDFFPNGADQGHYDLTLRSDEDMKKLMEAAELKDLADRCLRTRFHAAFATTAFSNAQNVSLETPHNITHGICGGLMANFQSAFHPIFWLHHSQVDRFYEAYLRMEPDSLDEFRQHQAEIDPLPNAPGFPQGPFGPHAPFSNFHARDAFDLSALGARYDRLPEPAPLQLREMPFFCVFQNIDLSRVVGPCNLFVYLLSKDDDLAFFQEATRTPTELTAPETGFAGMASIFFLDHPGGCRNCQFRAPWDEQIDVSRRLKELPSSKEVVLRVLVAVAKEASQTHFKVKPLSSEDHGIPAPELRGPKTPDDEHALLKLLNVTATNLTEAITKFQTAVGLTRTGIPSIETMRALFVRGLHDDDHHGTPPTKDLLTYAVDLASVPKSLDPAGTLQEIAHAASLWSSSGNVRFKDVTNEASDADIMISFRNRSHENNYIFDGHGGALAMATSSEIVLDRSEFWELVTVPTKPHPRRKFGDKTAWFFKVLPVVLHEFGHVLGLGHSDDPRDVMSPVYVQTKITLSDGDVKAARDLSFPLQ